MNCGEKLQLLSVSISPHIVLFVVNIYVNCTHTQLTTTQCTFISHTTKKYVYSSNVKEYASNKTLILVVDDLYQWLMSKTRCRNKN